MGVKLTMVLCTVAAAAIGFAAVSSGSGEDVTHSVEPTILVQEIIEDEASSPDTKEVQTPERFENMAVDSSEPTCRVPRPPSDLSRSAYIRNGYAAIRKIMAMQMWQETGSCECFSDQISWQEAVTESEKYVTSDNPLLPFDVVALQKVGDGIEAARRDICER